MTRALAAFLVLIAGIVVAQEPPATIRAEVKSDAGPVEGARVAVNGRSTSTGPDGVATLIVPVGHVEINVTKEKFFPAHVFLDIDAAREWPVQIEVAAAERGEVRSHRVRHAERRSNSGFAASH